MPDGPRYDDDYYAWTQYQAEVLRTMHRTDNRLDRELVAEEIEDLGKSEREAVRSQIVRIIEHLLKLQYLPAIDSRYDWMASIVDARRMLADKIAATLRADVERTPPSALFGWLRTCRDRPAQIRRECGDLAGRLPLYAAADQGAWPVP